MIHGKTKIELYNPNTKIKQIFREENTFQSSVLADYLRSLGEANNNPFANATFKGAKPWQNLVGGIFLFRDAIDLTGGVVKYMPAGNRMIGNGAYQISNGSLDTDPSEMGSWNDSESSASGSAITQVYDFATNQANGTIGCVCLTSQTGGYIGYGNESGKVKSAYDFKRNQNYQQVDNSNTNTGYSTVVGNFKYSFWGTTINNVFTIIARKTRVAITQASVFDGFYSDKNFDTSVIGNHANISLGEFTPCVDGTDIYLMPFDVQNVGAGAKGYFYKYDTTDDTLTEIEFTNSSSLTLRFGYSAISSRGSRANIANGLLFVSNSNNKISVFKLSNGEYIQELNIDTSYIYAMNTASSGHNGIVFVHGTSEELIYDTTTDACRPTNGNRQTNPTTNVPFGYDSASDSLVLASGSPYLYKSPLYLATINNLQNPVTKTAAQTMKVTYTLTEE